jgi:hypothetical protein
MKMAENLINKIKPDYIDSSFNDYNVIVDPVTYEFRLPFVPEEGEEINIYVSRLDDGRYQSPVRIDDINYLTINQTNETIICTLDKDLLQVPGSHFSWEISGKGWTRPDRFVEQTELEGLRLFYEQCLKGDTSDNIKGIEKIGEKKAKVMLAGCQSEQEMFNIVRNLYGNDDEFIMNARVLWILRSIDDDWKKRFVANIQK